MSISRNLLHDRLQKFARDCAQPGWEGVGSQAVESHTLSLASELIDLLPEADAPTEISAEPDGHVNLEWYRAPRRVLTVSVGPTGVLHWAALLGDEDPRGSCPFRGTPPETIRYWIRRVIGE